MPYTLDESWIDVTGSLQLFGGDAMLVTNEIPERVKDELGLTASVGVSWNKVFAKLGSDTGRGHHRCHQGQLQGVRLAYASLGDDLSGTCYHA